MKINYRIIGLEHVEVLFNSLLVKPAFAGYGGRERENEREGERRGEREKEREREGECLIN